MERRNWLRHRERGGTLATVVAIIGGLILAGLLAAFIALYFVARHVKVDVKSGAEGKQVQIETPFGGLKVRKAEDVAQELNLPLYPGAIPTEDSASVSLWGGTEEEQEGFDLTIATFHTDDPLETVDAWYRQQLSSEFRREPGRIVGTRGDRRERRIRVRADRDGIAYIHERGGRTRGVGLEPRRGRVKIALFDVWEGRGQ